MGVSRREPLVGRRRERAQVFDYDPETAGTGASSTSTTSRRCASRTRRSSTLLHGKVLELVRDGVVDGAARRPPRRARRPRRLPARGCATRGVAHVWVEKILAPRRGACATGPSRGRSATSSSTTPPRCSSTRRARRRSPACGRASGRARPFEEVALDAQLEQATTTFAREVERLRVCSATTTAIPEALAALPVYRTYVEPWTGRGRADDDREAIAAAGRRPRSPSAPAPGARPRRVRHALPADLAARHGQGRRGHRLLPLRAAAGAQRGRRRPGALRPVGRRLPRRERRARAALPARPARHADPRHEALGRRARAHRRAEPRMADEWAARAPLAGPRGRCARPTRASATCVLQTLVGAWPIERRAARGLRREGAARGASCTRRWAEPDEDYEAAARRYAPGC